MATGSCCQAGGGGGAEEVEGCDGSGRLVQARADEQMGAGRIMK